VVRPQPSGMVARPFEQSKGKMNDRCGLVTGHDRIRLIDPL